MSGTRASDHRRPVRRARDGRVFSRGGTGLARQCRDIDWSRHCDRIASVDPVARRTPVGPGACLDDTRAVLPAGPAEPP